MRVRFALLGLLVVGLLSPGGPLVADERELEVESFDGFVLDCKVAWPAGLERADVKRVVVLLHGSGPQSMDLDLTSVTKDGKPNLYFKTLTDELVGAGFGVVRYHKRSYQVRLHLKKNPKYQASEEFKRFEDDVLTYFVDDARFFAGFARERFPGAAVYLLGVSQGTYLALQVASQDPEVAGVAMVGFFATSLETLVYEQTVYRSMHLFRRIDADGDGRLSKAELKASEEPSSGRILLQLPGLDADKDGALGAGEFKAANFSNLLLGADAFEAYRRGEAAYPRVADIIKRLQVPLLFFQGEWDNQTPAFHARAVKLANDALWKKPNLHFTFYPGLGHALDPRDRYDDIFYRPVDRAALQDLIATMRKRFPEAPE